MKPIVRDTFISLAFAVPVLAWVILTDQKIPWTLKSAGIYLIFAPITEEVIFRGGIQELLINKIPASLPKETANIITSVLFAILHLLLKQEPTVLLVFFPSLVLGWHYGRYRNLLAVIFIHFFYNLVLFL